MEEGIRLTGSGLPPRAVVPTEWIVRRRTEQRLWRAGLTIAGLSLAFGLYASSPILIDHLIVEGTERLPESTVLEQAEGLWGQHWLVARTGLVERRIRALPGVRDASANRWQWPLGQVVITVEERKPYARLIAGRHRFVLDEEGVAIRETGDQESSLPLLTGQPFAKIKLGGHVPKAVMARARHCLRSAARTELPQARKLVVDKTGGLTLYTESSFCVRLGRQEVARKLTLATCAFKSLRGQGVGAATLDLRALEAPTWSPSLT